MDPKPPADRFMSAPARGASTAMQRPMAQAFPPVDQHVVRPETREELVRGRLVMALPAKEPHAERHHELDYLLRGCVAPGYIGATDLLTRTGHDSDFATDACIRRAGIDPATKTRYLEELAFEVVGEQSVKDITMRAEDLTARGVRRVVAIFSKKDQVREWSREQGTWIVLDRSGTFEDPTLIRPIPVAALLDAVAADDAVAQALRAKGNRVLVEIAAEATAAAEAKAAAVAAALAAAAEAKAAAAAVDAAIQTRRVTLLAMVKAQDLVLTEAQQRRVAATTDTAALDRWILATMKARSAGDVFGDDAP